MQVVFVVRVVLGSFPPREATVWFELPWDIPYPGAYLPSPENSPDMPSLPEHGISLEEKGGGAEA